MGTETGNGLKMHLSNDYEMRGMLSFGLTIGTYLNSFKLWHCANVLHAIYP